MNSEKSYLDSLFGLHGKSVLLTGASSGIGEHWAWTLANAGTSKLALAARRVDRLKVLADSIQSKHPSCKVEVITMDVGSDAKVLVQCLDEIQQRFDIKAFDVLVNNAGVGPADDVLAVTQESFDQTMNINLRGPFFLAQETAKRWVEANKGKTVSDDVTKGSMSIINISSILGLRAGKRNSHYAVSKSALIHMTKSMAMELVKYKVRVNAIAPGYYRSEMTEEFYDSDAGKQYLNRKIPSKRLGELRELDGALLLLASDASSNMTGTVVVVDGGHLVSSL